MVAVVNFIGISESVKLNVVLTAIVMASANVSGAVLVTRDDQLLRMGLDAALGCKVASY